MDGEKHRVRDGWELENLYVPLGTFPWPDIQHNFFKASP